MGRIPWCHKSLESSTHSLVLQIFTRDRVKSCASTTACFQGLRTASRVLDRVKRLAPESVDDAKIESNTVGLSLRFGTRRLAAVPRSGQAPSRARSSSLGHTLSSS